MIPIIYTRYIILCDKGNILRIDAGNGKGGRYMREEMVPQSGKI
jgi:hypothetical protein